MIRSSGHSGHGWTCCWLDPVANEPERIRPETPSGSRGWIATIDAFYNPCCCYVSIGGLASECNSSGEDGHDY
jgi:hypothetical protein